MFIKSLALSFFLSDIVMEEAPTTPILAPPVLHTPPPPPPPPTIAAAPSLPPPPTPPSPAVTTDRDGGRRGGGGSGGGRLGLTKEVLSAHTQQEEQNFMCRFRDLSQLRVFDPSSVLRQHTTTPATRGRVISVHIHTCIHKHTQTGGIYTLGLYLLWHSRWLCFSVSSCVCFST